MIAALILIKVKKDKLDSLFDIFIYSYIIVLLKFLTCRNSSIVALMYVIHIEASSAKFVLLKTELLAIIPTYLASN